MVFYWGASLKPGMFPVYSQGMSKVKFIISFPQTCKPAPILHSTDHLSCLRQKPRSDLRCSFPWWRYLSILLELPVLPHLSRVSPSPSPDHYLHVNLPSPLFQELPLLHLSTAPFHPLPSHFFFCLLHIVIRVILKTGRCDHIPSPLKILHFMCSLE